MGNEPWQRIEAKVDVILKLLESRETAPARYSLVHASERLDISKSKLHQRIRSGEVMTVWDGARQFVPDVEMRRMCTPKKRPTKNVVLPSRKQRAERAFAMATKARAALRKRR